MESGLTDAFNQLGKVSFDTGKVLVVGAGGIGCEVLKNLVLCGFNNIEIIDLDTIDVSNLNRQFLFQKQHVGKSKAAVAKANALAFNPNVNIEHHHDSITNVTYNIDYFKQFKVVLCALDNRTARNHVNRMCLAAEVPMVDSGTAGFYGQVEVISKGLSKCYECELKPSSEKTYPGCTIRNTPSELIHCVVWAKHLFNQLFGEEDADNDVSPDTSDPEAVGSAGNSALSEDNKSENSGNVERKSTRGWAQENDYDAKKLFHKFFNDDIKYLLSMEKLWVVRKPPTPLEWSNLPDEVASSSSQKNEEGLKHMKQLSVKQWGQVFADSLAHLKEELRKKPSGDYLVWDKDDKHAMEFVAACSNIRAHIFKIQEQTLFKIKSMAGNIIPAIATTNAIIAGVVVLRAVQVIKGRITRCPTIYFRHMANHRGQVLVPERDLTPPNPQCMVCSEKHTVAVFVNTHVMTIKEFEETILKKALNMVAPDVMLPTTKTVIISSEEGETECNNAKLLKDMGITHGCLLKTDDFLQNYELDVIVNHYVAKHDEPAFLVKTTSELQPKPEKPRSSKAASRTDDDDLIIDEPPSTSKKRKSGKRKLKRKGEASPKKKAKQSVTSEEEDANKMDDIVCL